MNMIAEDWIKSSDQDRRLMIRRAQIARIIITCSYCIMALQCFFTVVLPIFGTSVRMTSNITDPGRPMPVQTHYFYDITKKPQFELTFTSQAVFITIAMLSYIGIDNFLSLLIFHVCGQLDIIENRLTHLDKYSNYHEVLKYCIAKHIRLLRYVTYIKYIPTRNVRLNVFTTRNVFYRSIVIIEDTYNVMLLSLFIYFAVLFAFYAFQITSVSVQTLKNSNLFINFYQ
jgi:hypothetical protein